MHLKVAAATDNERVEAGVILVAPPDHHLLLVSRGYRARPRKISHAPLSTPCSGLPPSHIARTSSGWSSQETWMMAPSGLQAIKACGGVAIVQDPATAVAQDMPRSALEHVEVDYCLPLEAIAGKLVQLSQDKPKPRGLSLVPPWIPVETKMNLTEQSSMEELDKIGHQSKLTCPECNGVLWEVKNPTKLRYRCHTGHSFTGEALDVAQNVAFEEAIWFAIRALHEKQRLLKRLADSAREGHRESTARDYDETASQAAQHAAVLQQLVSVRQSA